MEGVERWLDYVILTSEYEDIVLMLIIFTVKSIDRAW